MTSIIYFYTFVISRIMSESSPSFNGPKFQARPKESPWTSAQRLLFQFIKNYDFKHNNDTGSKCFIFSLILIGYSLFYYSFDFESSTKKMRTIIYSSFKKKKGKKITSNLSRIVIFFVHSMKGKSSGHGGRVDSNG